MARDSVFSPLGTSIENAEITDGTIAEAKLATAVQTLLNDKGAGYIPILLHLPDSVIQGTWSHEAGGGNRTLGTALWNSSNANEDKLGYKVYLAAGTYTMKLLYGTDANNAKVTVEVDGSKEIDQLDTYSGSTVHNNVETVTGITVSSAGIIDITVMADDRHGSSSAYYLRLQALVFYRTA